MMKEVKRPPLGLVPRDIWFYNVLKERIKEIMEALNRYMEAEKKVPVEWIEEYNNTLEELGCDHITSKEKEAEHPDNRMFELVKLIIAGQCANGVLDDKGRLEKACRYTINVAKSMLEHLDNPKD